jgi:hypothetical protein
MKPPEFKKISGGFFFPSAQKTGKNENALRQFSAKPANIPSRNAD